MVSALSRENKKILEKKEKGIIWEFWEKEGRVKKPPRDSI